MILEVEFQGKQLSWNQMKKSVGPMTIGTDYGNCCFFAPQVNFGTNTSHAGSTSGKKTMAFRPSWPGSNPRLDLDFCGSVLLSMYSYWA